MTTIEHVDMGLPASFVWDYGDRRPRLTKLYEKSKVSQWNASTDLDWDVEVDPGVEPDEERFAAIDWGDQEGPIADFLRKAPERRPEFIAQDHGWLVSQFMHGERGALVATAKITAAAESIDDKYYAAAQVGDEARHVAFGVLSLQGVYADMDPVDLREREEFVLEACTLMRDRFQPVDVWQRFGLDVEAAKRHFAQSADMAAFRSLLFSKVVPNLRKLGLLTPRVRDGFEQMGILRYERFVDSATEAGELDPEVDTSDPLGALRASLAGVDKVEPGPVLQVLQSMADPSAVGAAGDAVLHLRVTGSDQPDWLVTLAGGRIDVTACPPDATAETTVVTGSETWTGVVSGRMTAPAAFLDGKLDVTGDMTKALALEALL